MTSRGAERNRVPYKTLVVALAPLAVGAMGVYIGALDLTTSLTFGTRVTGSILLLLGGISVSAPVAVALMQARASNSAGVVALTGAASAAVLAFAYVVLQSTIGPWRWTTTAGIGLLAVNIWCCYALVSLAGVKVGHPRITTLVSFTAALGLVGFIRSDIYVPGAAPQLVALSIAAGEPAQHVAADQRTVPLEITVENKGSMRVHIIASSYDAYGRVAVEHKDDNLTTQEMRDAAAAGNFVSRYEASRSFELLQSDHLVDIGYWLEPGEVMSTRQLIRISNSAAYDALTVNANVSTTRGDRAEAITGDNSYMSWDRTGTNVVELPPDLRFAPGTPFIYSQFQLREASRLRELVRPPMMATTYWILADPAVTSPRSNRTMIIHPADDRYAQQRRTTKEWARLTEMYGAVRFEQNVEVSLSADEETDQNAEGR